MPSTISAGTTAGTAIAIAGDTSGDLAFRTNGTTTAMTINTSQNVQLNAAGARILNSSGNPILLQTGSVLQVVQTVKTDTFSNGTTSSWFDITGMSVNITPTSSSNRILVDWTLCYSGNSGAIGYYLRLVRNSTAIAIGDAAGSRQRATQGITPANVDSYGGGSSAITFLDSPATTSATTYKVQLYQIPGTQALFINRSWDDGDASDRARWVSTITAMEVAA